MTWTVITDTEAVRAAVRRVQRHIQGPAAPDFWGVEYRAWVGIAADIMCEAAMEDRKDQFHSYIQEKLAGVQGDWMSVFLDLIFEELGIWCIDQLWP